jgi:hypothetical protein
MEPKAWVPVYEEKQTLVEIDLRGRFLMMACDFEWTMLHIMMHCAPDPMNQVRRFNSKEMMLHNKIECTISDLRKYKPLYYEEYKHELEKLWEFKDLRNDLAHLKLQIENSNFENFRFYFIDDDGHGKEKLFYKHYTIEYFMQSLKKFADLHLVLAKLVERLQADMKTEPENDTYNLL